MPFHVAALIVISHILLLFAGISLIVAMCAELWDQEQAKRAAELARAVERHPAGSARKEGK